MDLTLTWAALALVVIGLSFVTLFRRLLAPAPGVEVERIQAFSVEKYRPMGRLLDEADYQFLRTAPGYAPDLERRLRCERRVVFRAYLRRLRKDFQCLHRAARLVVAQGAQDRPDLAWKLMRQSLLFWFGFGLAHMRLGVHTLGLSSPVIPVFDLVESTNWMRRQVFDLRPVAAASR